MERLLPIRIPPGFYRNGTAYEGKGRWIDGSLVRFHGGALRPVGGWAIVRDAADLEVDAMGFPRGSHSWRANDASPWLAVGTTGTPSKAYVFAQNVLTDITPAGLTDGAADGVILLGTTGWGEEGWGEGPWGGTAGSGGSIVDADTWSFDNFGEVLLGCLSSDGRLWSHDLNLANDLVVITNAPTNCRGLVVTGERFLFALGADGDPRKVAWPSQETLTTWTPGAGNSAGDFILQSNGQLITGERTARETLLFTDADVWGAVYIGGPFIYSFQQRGDSCGIIGPNAVGIMDGAAFWMSDGNFHIYDGAVRAIPCDVLDYVFGDLNRAQRAKIQAVPVSEFGEMWWYYPSESQSGSENDRYVAVNRQGQWITGDLARATGVGAGVFAKPQLFDTSGKLYTHETGFDHGGAIPFIESGPFELGDGDQVMRVQKLIPDERILGQVRATLFGSFEPTSAETSYGPFTVAAKTDVRATGRQFRIRFDENIELATLADGSEEADGDIFATGDEGQDWRIGHWRAGVIPGGRR